MTELHLICNAHIDPVYLWQWEEGAAEALATFRIAAEFCENRAGFIFNHNEALLYRWIKEYDPELFARIKTLVDRGRWHIMGGWYLQPDCNMPSGESMLRQILAGRRFFLEEFGKRPTTAINFDPFGHSRGLVQLLSRFGYDSYLFCRPIDENLELPAEDFLWEGYDGSLVRAHRGFELYKSRRGEIENRINAYLDSRNGSPYSRGLLLWGIGNHGGGPSAEDLKTIDYLSARFREEGLALLHSTPEEFFSAEEKELPTVARELNPWGVGCYTSQIRVKQKHRALENALYAAEKIASHAALTTDLPYPAAELKEALDDLLLAEFHDILPGSSVPEAEKDALRLMDHGLEILSRVRARALFALCRKESAVPAGLYPIYIYNPHPWPVEGSFACEFQLADQNLSGSFTDFIVRDADGRKIPAQLEQEESNMPLDWRKRLVLRSELKPYGLNRFLCEPVQRPQKPTPLENPRISNDRKYIRIRSEAGSYRISRQSGLLEMSDHNGRILLGAGSCRALVMEDNADPWGSLTDRFDRQIGSFELKQATSDELPPLRVIESGEVRTVVEGLFAYGSSSMVVRYACDHRVPLVDLDLRIAWAEADRMLKLQIDGEPEFAGRCVGQTLFGREEYTLAHRENVSQQWSALFAHDPAAPGLAVLDRGNYGFHYADKSLFISLLRSPAYCAYPVRGYPELPLDRHTPRMDQGERRFRFRLLVGASGELAAQVDRRALEFNQEPYALALFPAGRGEAAPPLMEIEDESIIMSACKQAEDGRGYIIRLFEGFGEARRCLIRIPGLKIEQPLEFSPFEIKTLTLNPEAKSLTQSEVDEN